MQQKLNFKGKKIAVVGAGVEGLSSKKYLSGKGAIITLLDKKDGDSYLEKLDEYDLVVRSPGIKITDLEKFVSKDKITSQTKLFFDLCPAKIIGVTGTKGKGTTSSIIYKILKKDGKDAYLGGNIGLPPFEFLDKLNTHSIVVLELSSFQLMDLTKSPHIGVVLMVTSEHLNYHKDIYEYVDSKRNLLRFQNENDFAIVNRDYPASNESDVFSSAKTYYISRERGVYDSGCFVEDKAVWIQDEGVKEKVINTSDILLPGKHNLENVCAATMAAVLAGVSLDSVKSTLSTFKGLEHRLELVDRIKGVSYYDDSFSTTPETAIAAIEAFDSPEILILGGSTKNSDFHELGMKISKTKNIKAIIGIGEEWERIKEQIVDPVSEFVVIEGAKDMFTIVQAAEKLGVDGDVVLLSPACASFDMFKNYKDRGDQFKKEVEKLRNSLN